MGWEACHDTIELYRDRRRQFGLLGVCHDTTDCIVTDGGLKGWRTVSRYTVLYLDKVKGLAARELCHDTVIVS